MKTFKPTLNSTAASAKRCLKSRSCFNYYLWSEMIKYRFVIARKWTEKVRLKTWLKSPPWRCFLSVLGSTVEILCGNKTLVLSKRDCFFGKRLEYWILKVQKHLEEMTSANNWDCSMRWEALRSTKIMQSSFEDKWKKILPRPPALDKLVLWCAFLIQFCNSRWFFME